MDEWLKPGEVAKMVRCHIASVYRAVLRGTLPARKLPGGGIRIARADVDVFLSPVEAARRPLHRAGRLASARKKAEAEARTEETLRRFGQKS